MSEEPVVSDEAKLRREALGVSFLPSEFMVGCILIAAPVIAGVTVNWWLGLLLLILCALILFVRVSYAHHKVNRMNAEQLIEYIKAKRAFFRELAEESY